MILDGGRVALVAVCAWWLATGVRDARQDGVSTLDEGAFTVEQASRGKVHYQTFCASCHVGDLSGTLAGDTGAPPLRGAPFMASLRQKGAAGVFSYVRATMPADDPASLEDARYLDILAYLMQANGFRAGVRELTAANLPRVRVPPSP